MSLTAMIHGQGVVGCFEGVSAETMAKYNIDNGPVVMAMECAELLNTAFMEGFYTVNDVEISAAMEGYQSVTESSEKAGKVKEALVKAGKAIAEAFRKMGNAIRGFFANIGNKIKEKALKSDVFFNKLPGSVKTITYEGYEYKLDDLKDRLYDLNPDDRLKEVDEMIKERINIGLTAKNYKEEFSENVLGAIRKYYNIDDTTSWSDGLWSYFRSGAKKGQVKECKIVVSEAKKMFKGCDKLAKELDKISKDMEKKYLGYATKCEQSVKGDNSEAAEVWRVVASCTRELNTVVMTLTSSWLNAYNEASSMWVFGAREYIKTEKEGNSGDGEE